ncbi:class F sortase [Catellatospora citrea]|uniref:class F sortase n=1 Tax=Catellatospora citrea TaxID=53366 RepID=UPI0033CC93BD
MSTRVERPGGARRRGRRRPVTRLLLAAAVLATGLVLLSAAVLRIGARIADTASQGIPSSAEALFQMPTIMQARQHAGPPDRVRVRSIGVDSALETLTVDEAGALRPPEMFAVAGWYAEGPTPGDIGPAVIAGHVDSKAGPAVFFRLHEVRPGDSIEVRRDGTWIRFRVVEIGRYRKNRFPTEQVYGPTPGPELRLVTCGGVFDQTRRTYLDNVVVYAVAW